MGERTRSRIGTTEGVKTVRVYSANPKTADGYNTFIFRRDIARSLSKLAWAPVIDGSRNPVPEGIEVGAKSVRYSAGVKRRLVEFVERIANAQKGPIENDDFGHFEITKVFATEVQCHAISTRREIESVSSAAEIARSMIHFVGSPNEEMKRKKPNKYFEYGLAKIRLSDGIYLVMGEVGIRVNKRPYYDQRVVAKFKVDSEVTSLHGQTQIGESTFERVYDSRFRLILQGVAKYYAESSTKGCQCPKISVIVPVYKVEPYLRRCVDSVLAQTFKDFELILVDDGSPDRCGEICDEYARRDSRVVVVHQDNGGLSAARNAGIEWVLRNSKSEFLNFVDSDDWVEKRYLEILYAGIVQTGALVSVGGCRETNGMEKVLLSNDDVVERMSPEEYWCSSIPYPMVSWGKLYARTLFENIRFPVGRINEDEFVTHQVLFPLREIAVSRACLYNYFVREGSILRTAWNVRRLDYVDALDLQIDYFKLHGYVRAWQRVAVRQMSDMASVAWELRKMKGECHLYWREYRRRMIANMKGRCKDVRLTLQERIEIYSICWTWLVYLFWPIARMADLINRRGFVGTLRKMTVPVLGALACLRQQTKSSAKARFAGPRS